jgi:hypothetical protein
VARRNDSLRPGDPGFHITPAMFAFAEQMFEPLDRTEEAEAVHVST